MKAHIEKLEEATELTTAALILGALNHSGTDCILYKKKKVRASDSVYGVYGGSELSNLPSPSIYDQPSMNLEELSDEEKIDLDAFQLPNREVIIDDSFEQPVKLVAVISAFSWRTIESMISGGFEEPTPIFVQDSCDVSVGDVIQIEKGDDHFRFKVFGKQVIGRQPNVVARIMISNIGD